MLTPLLWSGVTSSWSLLSLEEQHCISFYILAELRWMLTAVRFIMWETV